MSGRCGGGGRWRVGWPPARRSGVGKGAAGAVWPVVGRSRRSGHRLLQGSLAEERQTTEVGAAPPTPRRARPPRCDQWEGTGPRDVTGRRQTSPGPSAPPPRMLRCLQAPPGVLSPLEDAGMGARGERDAGWLGGVQVMWEDAGGSPQKNAGRGCGMQEWAEGQKWGDREIKRQRAH